MARVHKESAPGSYLVPSYGARRAPLPSRLVSDALWALSLTQQIRRLRALEISPVELARCVLDRISQHNPRLLAYCALEPELVLAQARTAERQLLTGEVAGALCGVPIGIKDLIFARGLPTTGGSPLYRDFVPDEDDVTVERLRAAGAVILGKTNVPEFGFGPGSTNTVYGQTRNPWNPESTPGGSSGGSAAAVAMGMGAAALGSDGGGSIRVPSSFCGVYGLKPSFGRIPLYPGCRDARFPGFSAWESIEHIGPITRTVGDAALLLDVLSGPDPRDRHSLPREAQPFVTGLDEPTDVRGMRIAWTLDLVGYARVDPVVAERVRAAAETFASLGARVVEVTRTPPFHEDPGHFFETVVAMDADLGAMRALSQEKPGSFNARISAMLKRTWTAEEFSFAAARRQALYNQLWRFFANHDLLLTPTTVVPAFDVDRALPPTIDGNPDVPSHALSWFTLPFNLTGNPAASVPCGWTPDGLPIGLQIVGNHLADRAVLRASLAFEQARPWADRWPAL